MAAFKFIRIFWYLIVDIFAAMSGNLLATYQLRRCKYPSNAKPESTIAIQMSDGDT